MPLYRKFNQHFNEHTRSEDQYFMLNEKFILGFEKRNR